MINRLARDLRELFPTSTKSFGLNVVWKLSLKKVAFCGYILAKNSS